MIKNNKWYYIVIKSMRNLDKYECKDKRGREEYCGEVFHIILSILLSIIQNTNNYHKTVI